MENGDSIAQRCVLYWKARMEFENILADNPDAGLIAFDRQCIFHHSQFYREILAAMEINEAAGGDMLGNGVRERLLSVFSSANHEKDSGRSVFSRMSNVQAAAYDSHAE